VQTKGQNARKGAKLLHAHRYEPLARLRTHKRTLLPPISTASPPPPFRLPLHRYPRALRAGGAPWRTAGEPLPRRALFFKGGLAGRTQATYHNALRAGTGRTPAMLRGTVEGPTGTTTTMRDSAPLVIHAHF